MSVPATATPPTPCHAPDRVSALHAPQILDHPGEPKYQRFKSSNAVISKKLLRVPGGTELLIACGFRVRVIEFEEHWEHTPDDAAALGVLLEAREALEKYRQIVASRQEAAARTRAERLAGMDEARKRTLANIEEDKAERKDRVWVRRGHDAAGGGGALGEPNASNT